MFFIARALQELITELLLNSYLCSRFCFYDTCAKKKIINQLIRIFVLTIFSFVQIFFKKESFILENYC